jgi:hypothetical protein
MRLTPEREKEIRDWNSKSGMAVGFVDLLLAEIDALRILRLIPEREKEIREFSDKSTIQCPKEDMIYDLIIEIDALRNIKMQDLLTIFDTPFSGLGGKTLLEYGSRFGIERFKAAFSKIKSPESK